MLPEDSFIIFTNGNPLQQRNKVKQIVWPEGFIHATQLICANETKPKPSCLGIQDIVATAQKNRTPALFVGDTDIDHQTALAAQIPFFNIDELALINNSELTSKILDLRNSLLPFRKF
jgi:hypothetical protein